MGNEIGDSGAGGLYFGLIAGSTRVDTSLAIAASLKRNSSLHERGSWLELYWSFPGYGCCAHTKLKPPSTTCISGRSNLGDCGASIARALKRPSTLHRLYPRKDNIGAAAAEAIVEFFATQVNCGNKFSGGMLLGTRV
jgi:hypothetical protein